MTHLMFLMCLKQLLQQQYFRIRKTLRRYISSRLGLGLVITVRVFISNFCVLSQAGHLRVLVFSRRVRVSGESGRDLFVQKDMPENLEKQNLDLQTFADKSIVFQNHFRPYMHTSVHYITMHMRFKHASVLSPRGQNVLKRKPRTAPG